MAALLSAKINEAIEHSELFSFFCFEPVPNLFEHEVKKIGFKPTGEALRDFATLFCQLDETDRIQSMELILGRSFIDDPAQGIFAADLAKSFIYAGIGRNHASSIRELAAEIESRASTTRPFIVATGKSRPEIKNEPISAGYRTFRGEIEQEQISAGAFLLKLSNIDLQDSRALSLKIEKCGGTWFQRICNLF